jgi:membrane-bound ClpP family serine protease
MTLTGILVLIAVALILILLEVFVLPGINVAGIAGILLLVLAIYFSYKDLGTPVAHFILGGTLVASISLLVLALRSNTWQRLSLKTTIDSKVDSFETGSIKPGDTGETLTRLGPIGKVIINGQTVEAKSQNKIINANTAITVVKLEGKQIIVKPTE